MVSIISFSELTHAMYLDGWYSAESARDATDLAPIPNEVLNRRDVQLFLSQWEWSPQKGNWPAKLMGALYAAGRLPLYESRHSAYARDTPIIWSTHEFVTEWNYHKSLAVRSDDLHDCLTGLRLPLPAWLFPESELNTTHAIKQGPEEFDRWFDHWVKVNTIRRKIAADQRDLDSGKCYGTERLALEQAIESSERELERMISAATPLVSPVEQPAAATPATPPSKKPRFDDCYPSGYIWKKDWGDVLRSALCNYIKERGNPGYKTKGINAVYNFLSGHKKILSFKITSGKHDNKDCLLLDGDPEKFLTKETLRGLLTRGAKQP